MPSTKISRRVVLDFANDSVIPNPISPKFSKAGSLQGLAKAARIS